MTEIAARPELSIRSLLASAEAFEPFLVSTNEATFSSRKRGHLELTGSTSSVGEKSFDYAPGTPELVASEDSLSRSPSRLSLIDAAESDSDVASSPASPVISDAKHPRQPSREDAGSTEECPVDESHEIFDAASVLFRLWSQARVSSPNMSSKRAKMGRGGRDEEAYVPKAAVVRRTKKHVNKDVRIPNSCDVHKKRHLKCPMDCPERKKREMEQRLLDMQLANESADGDAGSSSDIEAADAVDA